MCVCVCARARARQSAWPINSMWQCYKLYTWCESIAGHRFGIVLTDCQIDELHNDVYARCRWLRIIEVFYFCLTLCPCCCYCRSMNPIELLAGGSNQCLKFAFVLSINNEIMKIHENSCCQHRLQSIVIFIAISFGVRRWNFNATTTILYAMWVSSIREEYCQKYRSPVSCSSIRFNSFNA